MNVSAESSWRLSRARGAGAAYGVQWKAQTRWPEPRDLEMD